jgi:SAM-dependent methyltransferase
LSLIVKEFDENGRKLIRAYLACCRQVVDLGCNVKKIRPDAVGYDLDPAFGISTDFNQDNLDKIPPGFDGICLSHILEHIVDVRKFLKTCYEKLPPGGKIAVCCPDGEAVPPETLGDSFMTHEMLFTAKTLSLYLKHAGFIKVSSIYYPRPYAYQQVRGIFARGQK